jgi:hypothetical protein
MAPQEAVKMCLCGTIGGFLHGSRGVDLTSGLAGTAVSQVVMAVTDLAAGILLLYTIWWLIHTVAAIGRASTRA